jgi:hypothetical protein
MMYVCMLEDQSCLLSEIFGSEMSLANNSFVHTLEGLLRRIGVFYGCTGCLRMISQIWYGTHMARIMSNYSVTPGTALGMDQSVVATSVVSPSSSVCNAAILQSRWAVPSIMWLTVPRRPIVTTSVSSATSSATVHRAPHQKMPRESNDSKLLSLLTTHNMSKLYFVHRRQAPRKEENAYREGQCSSIGSPTSLRPSLHESPDFSRYASNQITHQGSRAFRVLLPFIRTRSCDRVYRLLSAT